jgi:hypothetical protein
LPVLRTFYLDCFKSVFDSYNLEGEDRGRGKGQRGAGKLDENDLAANEQLACLKCKLSYKVSLTDCGPAWKTLSKKHPWAQ